MCWLMQFMSCTIFVYTFISDMFMIYIFSFMLVIIAVTRSTTIHYCYMKIIRYETIFYFLNEIYSNPIVYIPIPKTTIVS